MSLENAIALLTQQVGLARDQMAGITAVATAQINAVSAEYQARIASMQTTLFVNQQTGLDTNPGTLVAPLKTIGRALEMTPQGGVCNCYLTASYNVDQHILVENRLLNLTSSSGVRHSVTFERYSEVLSLTYRGVRAFYVSPSGFVNFRGLTIVIPVVDGGWGNFTLFNVGLVNPISGNLWGSVRLNILECNYRIPAAPFCPLFPGAGLCELQFFGNVLDGAIVSMNGQVIAGVTNLSGTPVSGRGDILTNLTSI